MTTTPTSGADDLPEACTNLLAYVLQDDLHNRLTPRVIDIAYTAFSLGKQPNAEDGGPSYWFNDARPKVRGLIEKLRKDLMEDRAKVAAPQPSPTAPATQQPEGDVVAYLDVGANGYLDLGSELSEDALQQLPKGRHALVIAGTYGIDGYVAAPQPSYTAQAADSVQEDAARYRWLREGNDAKHGAAWHVAVNLYGCEWDAAIDAAMNK